MSIIFQPVRISNIELKNRLVRSATAERMADDQGRVTDELVKYYQQLAKGGIGTIITGHAFVREDGTSGFNMTGIYHNDLIPGLARLSQAAHEYEARVFVQLNHVGRYAPGSIIGMNPLAPSVTERDAGLYPPQEMTAQDIKEVIQSFGQAAERTREAGFDGVQIHSAHAYLSSQFLSPDTNKRKDEWGGGIENRARFLLEVLKSIRQYVGKEFPVWVKMNCEDFVEGGLTLEESLFVAEQLAKAGINAIEISGGVSPLSVIRLVARGDPEETRQTRLGREVGKNEPEAYFLPQAEQFRNKLKVPLILVGGMRSLNTMEMLVKDKGFDLISLSRPLIREPDLPDKLRKKATDKATCISCNSCLRQKTKPIKCRVEEKIRLRIK